MWHRNLIGTISYAVTLSCISVLGFTGCSVGGGDPTVPEIITSSLPDGTVNQPYSTSVSGSGGLPPYTWSVTPDLPAGLSFDTTTGAITGTPGTGTVGTSSHTFTLHDSLSPPQTVQRSLTLTINPTSAVLLITTTSLPDGTVGQAYTQPVQATGGTGALTWSINVGTPPPGLSLDPTTGVISGTPTVAGTSSFTVLVTDTAAQTATQALSILINPPSPPTITTTSLPDGTVGQAYTQPVQATGGTGALTWSINVGTPPPGLSLDPTTGVISGTPTVAGTSSFTVLVTDTAAQTATQALSILINPPSPPTITTTSLPDGTVGQAYTQPVQATGGTGALTWSINVGTPPPGLSLDPTTGVISGTPTVAGTSSFTVLVTDTAAQTATQALSILINPPSPPTITTTSLPDGTVGQAYTQPVQATGGTGALTWSINVGTPPPGLSLDPTTGVISGTPTVAGTSSFTVLVTDTAAQTATQALSILINPPSPPTITTTSLPGGTVGQAYGEGLQATGGTGTLVWSLSGGSLPANLTLSSAGTISGTPNNMGTSNFTVMVTDALAQSVTQPLSIAVSAAMTITATSLPDASVGHSYSKTLQRSGGVSPFI
jgi:hypothetical protein